MEREKKITLTERQQRIFDRLLNYSQQLELHTVLRVAGGWVRDKIMGKQSHDIDIALDNMKGEEFLKKIKQLAQKKGHTISGYGVTKLNPELSKHLETATAQIEGELIDFVNLRSKPQKEISSELQIGTPKSDAELRDFTINSLFYNVNTKQVEDWTNNGLADLELGIIRTPLKPEETFGDDPLRVLRCFRFSARFNFKVDPSIYDYISRNQDLKNSLLYKVSRERIASELVGMLKTPNPQLALSNIRQNNLWDIIFPIPQNTNLPKSNKFTQQIPSNSTLTLQFLQKSLSQNSWLTFKQLTVDHEENQKDKKSRKKATYQQKQLKMLLFLSSLTIIYFKYELKTEKTTINLTQFMIKEQLKLSTKYTKFVMQLCQSTQQLQQLNIQNQYQLIRWIRSAQEKWELALHLLWATTQALNKQIKEDPLKIRQIILKKSIQNCFEIGSPIDGRYLQKKGIKGKSIGIILENAAIWQILHPQSLTQNFIQEFQRDPQLFQDPNAFR